MKKYMVGLLLLMTVSSATFGGENNQTVIRLSFEKLATSPIKNDSPTKIKVALEGKALPVLGKHGEAIRFDGSGYLKIPTNEVTSLQGNFTIELWVKPSVKGSPRLVDKSTPGKDNGYLLDLYPNNHLRFISSVVRLNSPQAIEVGKWTHVGITYDARKGLCSLYLNGRSVAESKFPAKKYVTVNQNPLCIGADSNGGNRFRGDLDEVFIYNRALSEEEMARKAEVEPFATVEPLPGVKPIVFWDKNRIAVNTADQIARNDVVYLSPATDRPEGLPLGNGRLGAMVWNEDLLNVQLNHGSLWRDSELLSSGRLHLKTTPGMKKELVRFEERLKLFDGSVVMNGETPGGKIKATCFIAEGTDVLVIKVRDERKTARSYRLDLEFWRKASVIQTKDNTLLVGENCVNPKNLYEYGDVTAITVRGVKTQTHRGPGQQLWLDWTMDTPGEFTIYAAVAVRRHQKAAPVKEARAVLDQAVGQDFTVLQEAVKTYWHNFWSKSLVYLNSDEGSADYLENLWYLHMYWTAAGSRGEYVPKFNGGNWLIHRDERQWGGRYWYQNTREQYWPILAANHPELGKPFYEMYWRTLPEHRENARTIFNKGGAQIQETMALDGTGDKKDIPYTCLYLSTGAECATQFYQYYKYTRDEDFLRTRAYPLLKEMIQFYLEYATKGADGYWHIYPTDARETYWYVKDGQTDLCAIRVGTEILLRESKRLGLDADLRSKWQDLHDHLAPLPIDRKNDIYAPAVFLKKWPPCDLAIVKKLYPPQKRSTSIKKRFNSENPECDLLYPWGLAGIGSANEEMAKRTFFKRQVQYSSGWQPIPIWAARLGLGKETVAKLLQQAESQCWSQGFFNSPASVTWGTYQYGEPYFDASGVVATAINEMLLQDYNGVIRVFPAWYDQWEGMFRLRSQTGFMVTGQREKKVILFVAVESLWGTQCQIVNPWSGTAVIRQGTKIILQSDAATLVFPTTKGLTYTLESATSPLAKMDSKKLQPALAKGPKYPRFKVIAPEAYINTGKRSFIGISATGLTPVRWTIRTTRDKTTKMLTKKIDGRKNVAAAKNGAVVTIVDSKQQFRLEPRLNDGLFGEKNSVSLKPARTVRIDLGKERKISGLVWSVDRECRWTPMVVSHWKYEIQVSADGNSWQTVYQGKNTKGITWGVYTEFAPVNARYVQMKIGGWKPLSLDEVEIY